MEEKMKQFGQSINSLIAGRDLGREQTRRLFSEILLGEQSEIHQGAFLSAITAKGPSPAEIAGAWEAIYELDTTKVLPETKTPLVDNCGTGMDAFKTFNISTGAAVVAAAGGVCVARHGARAITSRCGTVDLCEMLGVDVECDSDTVRQSIEKTGIGLFNGMSPATHPKALFRILSQMSFGSILNIAASLANPANPSLGVRGVYSEDMIDPVAQTMKEMGFKKRSYFMVPAATESEAWTNCRRWEKAISANWDRTAKSRATPWTPNPGAEKRRLLVDIAAGTDRREEALRLLRVLSGADKGPSYETICLNAAPIFYVADQADSLSLGLEKARETIDSGKALSKLRQWVKAQNRDPRKGEESLGALLASI